MGKKGVSEDSGAGQPGGSRDFFADESGIRSDFHAGTTWAPIGQTPVVKQTGQRFSLNMISAVSPKGQLRFMVTRKRIEASVFVEFLKRLMHGWGKSIFLIVDGHPTHKARLVKTFLERMKGKLRLFTSLPTHQNSILMNMFGTTLKTTLLEGR